MVCSLTPFTILNSSHHRVAFPYNWKMANRAFRLWSYSYSWKYLFIFISHASAASSYSLSKCGNLIFRNSPCNSIHCLFEVCCSDALSDRSSLSSDPSSVVWWFCSSDILYCSALGLAGGWFCLSDRLFRILSCSIINRALSSRNRAISFFNSCTVSKITWFVLRASSLSYTHSSRLFSGPGTGPWPIAYLRDALSPLLILSVFWLPLFNIRQVTDKK